MKTRQAYKSNKTIKWIGIRLRSNQFPTLSTKEALPSSSNRSSVWDLTVLPSLISRCRLTVYQEDQRRKIMWTEFKRIARELSTRLIKWQEAIKARHSDPILSPRCMPTRRALLLWEWTKVFRDIMLQTIHLWILGSSSLTRQVLTCRIQTTCETWVSIRLNFKGTTIRVLSLPCKLWARHFVWRRRTVNLINKWVHTKPCSKIL